MLHAASRAQRCALVTTGYTSDGEAQSLLARGASRIEKPYASAELARDVARMLAGN